MSEGDSICRMARRIEPVLLGKPILAATAPSPRSPLRRGHGRAIPALEGQTVERIEPRGKHLLLRFAGGTVLHSHMGMNGSWQVETPDSGFRRPAESAWLLLDVGGRRVAQFGGPTLRLSTLAALKRDPRLATLGPDILAAGFDIQTVAARLQTHPEQLGSALLDQRLLAGIGNIFKSEACFEAGLDPWRPATSLSIGEAEHVIGTARRQMAAAVESGRRPGMVYRKAGRPCPRCRAAAIRSAPQGEKARVTYWCPACQTKA